MKRFIGYIIATVGAFVSIGTFISWITSASVKNWVSGHSAWVFYAMALLFFAFAAALNYALNLRRRIREVKEEVDPHDQKLFQSFVALLPPDDPVIRWLKHNFIAKAVPSELFGKLESVIRDLDLWPLGFNGKQVEGAFTELKDSMVNFEGAVIQYCFYNGSEAYLSVPSEWPEDRYDEATSDIRQAWSALVTAYDSFFSICHAKGIDRPVS